MYSGRADWDIIREVRKAVTVPVIANGDIFEPEDAVRISLDNNTSFQVRLIDCVGFMVPGAIGQFEGENPRMVSTPWFEEQIPLAQAAGFVIGDGLDQSSSSISLPQQKGTTSPALTCTVLLQVTQYTSVS